MERVVLGGTGITVSKLGFGTGTAHPCGGCRQALIPEDVLSCLLLDAYENGVNFWDTALQYDTHRHLKEALTQLKRQDIVVTTKLISSRETETDRMLFTSLEELGTDYVDICLVHGVRTKRELYARHGALNSLLKHKKAGRVRAIGFSFHGLSALRSVTEMDEVDVAWIRINPVGLCMDKSDLVFSDQLASVPWLKKFVKGVLPDKMRASVRQGTAKGPSTTDEREEVESIIRTLHSQGKGIVAMKVLAEGGLAREAEESISYVKNVPGVDALIIGMQNRDEILRNCEMF